MNKLKSWYYYSTEDVATKLIEISGIDQKYSKDLDDAIYHLKTIAENSYNYDYYRILFNTLMKIAGEDF